MLILSYRCIVGSKRWERPVERNGRITGSVLKGEIRSSICVESQSVSFKLSRWTTLRVLFWCPSLYSYRYTQSMRLWEACEFLWCLLHVSMLTASLSRLSEIGEKDTRNSGRARSNSWKEESSLEGHAAMRVWCKHCIKSIKLQHLMSSNNIVAQLKFPISSVKSYCWLWNQTAKISPSHKYKCHSR